MKPIYMKFALISFLTILLLSLTSYSIYSIFYAKEDTVKPVIVSDQNSEIIVTTPVTDPVKDTTNTNNNDNSISTTTADDDSNNSISTTTTDDDGNNSISTTTTDDDSNNSISTTDDDSDVDNENISTNTTTSEETDIDSPTETTPENTGSPSKAKSPVFIDKMVGLQNYGQTCFANSAFQILYHSESFQKALSKYLKTSAASDKSEYSSVAKALTKVFDQISSTADRGKVSKPETFPALPPELRKNEQFDAAEVLRYISNFKDFDWSDFELKEKVFRSYFGADFESESDPIAINSLVLDFPKHNMDKVTMRELIDFHYSPVDLDMEGNDRKLLRITSFPQTILIITNRFFEENGQKLKDVSNIYLDDIVDLEKYFEADPAEKEPIDYKGKAKYEVTGFIKAMGKTIKSGHYLSYFKQSKRNWVEINDSVCTDVDLDKVLEAAKGGYIFMYQRIMD